MDYAPDGLAILSTYKHGSMKLRSENADLVVSQMQWLGLKSDHITDGDQTHQDQGLIQLTKRDRQKARTMLGQVHMSEDGKEGEWRDELQVMLVLNLKAELQIMDSVPGALMSLIRSALQ